MENNKTEEDVIIALRKVDRGKCQENKLYYKKFDTTVVILNNFASFES